ncbi:tubulin binding cofactor C-domain-containing protein [Sparassis latifolia]|uniref:TBCC-domain-containing protein n=1 Tax=Sparassis crispa TaxID=139825 RepID=A0A401GMM4_9APHY|nr:TBCC-domain-containing protein [Sparassis crispa]GBE83465.1 TBCC-domain-containing protein [Sparassis crispa]
MAETNQALIQEFHSHFQTMRSELTTRLEALKSGGATPDGLESLSLDVAKLRKELTDGTDFLPSYDQRQCELRLKNIEDTLENLRASSAPKPKFSFKRKVNKPAVSPSAAASVFESTPSAGISHLNTFPSSSLNLVGRSHIFLTWSSLPVRTSSASDLSIADLDYCVVNLLPSESAGQVDAKSFSITALHVRNISNSIVILPEIEGSALLHDLTRCVIVLGCHQYRMHTSSNVDVYLHVPSDPIIEHCTGIRFTGYPRSLHAAAYSPGSRIEPVPASNHLSVKDFSHIRASPSPNWSLLPEEKLIAEPDWPGSSKQDGANMDSVLDKLLPVT